MSSCLSVRSSSVSSPSSSSSPQPLTLKCLEAQSLNLFSFLIVFHGYSHLTSWLQIPPVCIQHSHLYPQATTVPPAPDLPWTWPGCLTGFSNSIGPANPLHLHLSIQQMAKHIFSLSTTTHISSVSESNQRPPTRYYYLCHNLVYANILPVSRPVPSPPTWPPPSYRGP